VNDIRCFEILPELYSGRCIVYLTFNDSDERMVEIAFGRRIGSAMRTRIGKKRKRHSRFNIFFFREREKLYRVLREKTNPFRVKIQNIDFAFFDIGRGILLFQGIFRDSVKSVGMGNLRQMDERKKQ